MKRLLVTGAAVLLGGSLVFGCGGQVGDVGTLDPDSLGDGGNSDLPSSIDGDSSSNTEPDGGDGIGQAPSDGSGELPGEPIVVPEIPGTGTGTVEPTNPNPTNPTTPPVNKGPQPAAIWVGDFETGNLNQYNTGADWNFEGSPRPTWPTIASTAGGQPLPVGKSAAFFKLNSGQKRQELIIRNNTYRNGDDLFFGFSLFVDGTYTANSWCNATQWKNDGTGSPPLEMTVQNNGFAFGGGFGHPSGNRLFHKTVPGGLVKGRWTDWVVHVRFASDSSNFIEVWMDGKLVLEKFSLPGGTLYPGLNSYHKMGLYCDPGNSGTRTLLHDNWRIGKSYDSVDPRWNR